MDSLNAAAGTGFVIGLIIGVVLMGASLALIEGSLFKEAREAYDLCIEELPRNQTCKIIAIPKE